MVASSWQEDWSTSSQIDDVIASCNKKRVDTPLNSGGKGKISVIKTLKEVSKTRSEEYVNKFSQIYYKIVL